MLRKRQDGFTLIELLVVVSTIALLVGILVPVLGEARAAANATVCLSNMRQMGLATTSYATDNKSMLPTIGMSHGISVHDPQGSWFFQLQDYADTGLLAACPDDVSPYFKTPEPLSNRLRTVSFGTNYYLTGLLPSFERFVSIDAVPTPSNVSHAFEIAELGEFASADHVHPELLLLYATDADTLRPEAEKMYQIDRHKNKPNWNFLDGHAEPLAMEETLLLDPASTFGNLIWQYNIHDPTVGKR